MRGCFVPIGIDVCDATIDQILAPSQQFVDALARPGSMSVTGIGGARDSDCDGHVDEIKGTYSGQLVLGGSAPASFTGDFDWFRDR
jgi:hypothetical protein